MTFNDNQLAMLKDDLCGLSDGQPFDSEGNYPHEVIQALIARLEAAERMEKPLQAFLGFHGEHKRDITCMDGMERTKYEVAKEVLEAWRKAAGKAKCTDWELILR